MALNKSEIKYSGEYLASQANGEMSREVVTLLSNATVYQPGDVLARIAATGKYTYVNTAANDGSETAVAINYARQDATSADVSNAPVTARDAEVNQAELNFGTSDGPTIANIVSDLASRNIICRTGV